ncbi:MAG: hypothetical protein K6T34_02170 [Thermoflavifilum sp.]|nr:hypothetical protein [Thermoflavifilum sp.]
MKHYSSLLTLCLGLSAPILCLMISCSHNEKDSRTDLSPQHQVQFKVSGFESLITPLPELSTGRKSIDAWRLAPHYLYYWSFNDSSLLPDIFLHSGTSIRYNDNQVPTSFATGFATDSFPAGLALSIRGLQEIIFQMPLQGVSTLSQLGFDISSSNTGPKDFYLMYSTDGGNTYDTLSASNPFTNRSNQARNSFSFALEGLTIHPSETLYIKIVPLPGDRSGISDYNASMGVTRIDNFYLIGTVDSPTNTFPVQELHYYLFRQSDSSLYAHGIIDLSTHAPDFQLNMPNGKYLVHLVANFSHQPLIWADSTASASLHYLANQPNNLQARIYGYADSLNVQTDQVVDAVLKRYYSQIRFQFTDTQGLDQITQIQITPLHPMPFYAPFNTQLQRPAFSIADSSFNIEFDPTTGSAWFNQFLGRLTQPATLQYAVSLFGKDGLLRTFQVRAAILNNVQLTFKGRAFLSSNTNFGVQIDEQWQGEQEVDF